MQEGLANNEDKSRFKFGPAPTCNLCRPSRGKITGFPPLSAAGRCVGFGNREVGRLGGWRVGWGKGLGGRSAGRTREINSLNLGQPVVYLDSK